MGFRGGGQIDPPQRILVFKYPSGDRVKYLTVCKQSVLELEAFSRLKMICLTSLISQMFKGTVLNLEFLSFNGRSLQITLTVTFNGKYWLKITIALNF